MLDDFLRAIKNGNLDDDLDTIVEVIKWRKNLNATLFGIALKKGDKVRFKDSTRPNYLAGITGTIRDKKIKKVVVDLDAPAGRFYKNISTPPSLLEKIDDN